MSDSPWTLARSTGANGPVTMVDGTSFMISDASGTIVDPLSHGLFALDTRIVSQWHLTVQHGLLEPVVFMQNGPFSGTFVARVATDGPDEPSTILTRHRHVGRGMREDIELRNYGAACTIVLQLEVDADLAGLFEVKSGHLGAPCDTTVRAGGPDGAALTLTPVDAADRSGVTAVSVGSSLRPTGSDPIGRTLTWEVDLGASETWSTCLQVTIRHDDRAVEIAHPCGAPIEEAVPVSRLQAWRDQTPRLSTGRPEFDQIMQRSIEDLGALRIFDPDHVDRVVVAAGAPWFMALFGRDSLIASWMALPFDQELAAGVLAELADSQGRRVDALTEEQPGRIMHEVRFDRLSAQLLGGARAYFGTVDATPLFVMLVAELARWTGISPTIERLMPAVDRALDWIDQFGDRDGDGFVEYERSNPDGLEHQGWKDSWDGIRDRHGAVVAPPIALCEVQAYVYAACRGRADLARALDEPAALADRWDERADRLRQAFDRSFWVPDLGAYAVGLDARKRPIESLTSNNGHLLWTGIVPEGRAAQVASSLVSDDLLSGWGIRTLSASNPAYNPLSYHCGSVWPHDTAIAVAGLARYGLDAEAQRVTEALVRAAVANAGRLPELFGGFADSEFAAPVPYPTACSPQAWSAAAPLLLVRSMLGLEPDVPAGTLRLRPRLAPLLGRVEFDGVRIGTQTVSVVAETSRIVSIDGAGPGLQVSVG